MKALAGETDLHSSLFRPGVLILQMDTIASSVTPSLALYLYLSLCPSLVFSVSLGLLFVLDT